VNGPLAPAARSQYIPESQEYTVDPTTNANRDQINPEDFSQSANGNFTNGTVAEVLSGESFAPQEQDNDQYGAGNL